MAPMNPSIGSCDTVNDREEGITLNTMPVTTYCFLGGAGVAAGE